MLSAVPSSHAPNASNLPSAPGANALPAPVAHVTPVSSRSAVPSGVVSPLSAADGPTRHSAPSSQWEHLWFSLVARGEWASLAIVPGSPGIDTLAVARMLAAVGHAYLDQPVLLVDATRVQPGEVMARLRASAERVAAGARVLVATDSPTERAACIAIARGVDAAVLVVQTGETDLSQARKATELIGAKQFLGAITLKPDEA